MSDAVPAVSTKSIHPACHHWHGNSEPCPKVWDDVALTATEGNFKLIIERVTEMLAMLRSIPEQTYGELELDPSHYSLLRAALGHLRVDTHELVDRTGRVWEQVSNIVVRMGGTINIPVAPETLED